MKSKSPGDGAFIKANLIHLGCNMWRDREYPEAKYPYTIPKPYLRVDQSLWDDIMRAMAKAGLNMVVIDLGEGVKYQSHPELAVKGSWSVTRLKKELGRIRKLGIEPIPKLNFSATHDHWLGPYSRMVSTPTYYNVCRDLIAEVCEIFDRPRLFHLGMDEETAQHQRLHAYAVMRQYDLWWDDLYFYIDQAEKNGARAWVWSDKVWHHPDEFYKKMPTSVLQSNWVYLRPEKFTARNARVRAYLELDAAGYDQVPTGSNHICAENIVNMAEYLKPRLTPERFQGLLQTPWRETLEIRRKHHMQAIRAAGKACRIIEKDKR